MKIYCALGKQQFKKWSEFCFSKQFQLTILQNVHLVKSLLFLEASKLTGYSLTPGPEGVVTKKMLWYPKKITKKRSLTKRSPAFVLIFYRILHLRIRKKTIQFLWLNIQSKWPKFSLLWLLFDDQQSLICFVKYHFSRHPEKAKSAAKT